MKRQSTMPSTVKFIVLSFLASEASAFTISGPSLVSSRGAKLTKGFHRNIALRQALQNDDSVVSRKRGPTSSLNAFAITQELDAPPHGRFSSDFSSPLAEFFSPPSVDLSGLTTVLTTALMVTGNTIGASSLVLPTVAAQPGMAAATGLFGAAYVVNLISGMVIAEVAIRQKENYGNDVPSSFKEFADASLNNPLASNLIAGISLFTNACVLSFDLVRAGDVTSCMLGGVSPIISTLGFAGLLVTCVSSLSGQVLARLASAAVTALFLSFFGILLPGLANVLDPVSTFLTPGLSDSGISEAAPIILMTLVYQNIVPSVTKILDYDRTKTLAAIGLGSFLPLFLYVAWCFACLGGGAAASGGLLLTVFSLAAVSGSSLGCVLSLSEEVESFLAKDKSVGDSTLNIWSVLAGVGVPVAAALVFAGSDDFTVALKLAGSYGSPLLYGAIPAFMAWKQLQESNSNSSQCEGEPSGRFDLIPGGSGTLAILGGASAVMVLQEFVTDFSGAVFS